jgi:hypothetical protein
MYINKIEEILDITINNFYTDLIEDKLFRTIIKEKNFVKYHKQIDEFINKFIQNNIDVKEINEVINDEDNILTVINKIAKYLCYYFFIFLGLNYSGKLDTFTNNLVEISKNQPNFTLKIDDYFTSYSNSNTIKYIDIVQKAIIILESEKTKQEKLSKDRDYRDAFKFLYELNPELLASIKLANLESNNLLQYHNIIKIIIIINMYIAVDKKDIYTILEETTKNIGEYIFIDIVVPKTEYIDYNIIESNLSSYKNNNRLAAEFYNMIIYDSQLIKKNMTADDKINLLIEKKILIPITEDFILYHRDDERYEIDDFSNVRKKQDTKIKYIVNKVNNASKLYNQTQTQKSEDISKYFYQPLFDSKKAVTINSIEDVIIINKLHNIGITAIENNEYYNDLINMRRYVYQSFKNLSKPGIILNINNDRSYDAVRSVSILGDNIRQTNLIECRVVNNIYPINIVGFIFNAPGVINTLQCAKYKDIIDIKDIKFKNKRIDNGIKSIIKLFNYTLFNNIKLPIIKWILSDSDYIKLKSYENIKKNDKSTGLKQMIAEMFNKLADSIIYKLYRLISSKEHITLQQFYKLIDYVNKKYINIDNSSIQFIKLNKYVSYEKIYKSSDSYDENLDIFYGYPTNKNTIKLPEYKAENPDYKKISIKIERDIIKEKEKDISEIKILGAVCQHYYSLKNILNSDNDLSNFIMQYIEEVDGEFVCKSCGSTVPIKKYVLDGGYDDEGRYITFASTINTPIYDMPEYEKYKIAVQNIDKLVDRLATICRMNFLIDTNIKYKNPVKLKVVKSVVDTLLIHMNSLKIGRYLDKNRENLLENYGLNKDLTNMFVFELDNSIFSYTKQSKEQDFYRLIKVNNITVFSLFYSLLELTTSHVYSIDTDKTCNYVLFSKVGYHMFDNIKIISNNKDHLVPIQKYKILCYLLFTTTCLMTKHNMWQLDSNTSTETKNKINPQTQKVIIHTLVEFINSFLYINNNYTQQKHENKKRDYLYNTVSTKFFIRLNSLFSDKDLLEKLKNIHLNREVSKNKITKTDIVKFIPIKEFIGYSGYLGDSYQEAPYDFFKLCWSARVYYQTSKFRPYSQDHLNNITNCESGKFHIWKVINQDLVCNLCKKTMKAEIELKQEINLENKYLNRIQKKKAKKLCTVTGELHDYDDNTCINCHYKKGQKIKPDELNKIISKIDEKIGERQLKLYRNNIKEEELSIKGDQDYKLLIKQLKNSLSKTKRHKEDFMNYTKIFTDKLAPIINTDNLIYDTYTVDHDHNGYRLHNNITIIDKDNKIKYKKNHPFFNVNTLYYINNKLNIEVYYDASTLLLLGYKEMNKEYAKSTNTGVYLLVNYSIFNRINMLGYPSKYVDINKMKNNLTSSYGDLNEEDTIKEIISEVCQKRIINLKKGLRSIIVILNSIKNKHEKSEKYELEMTENEKNSDSLVKKYADLSGLKYEYVFNNWKLIHLNLNYKKIKKNINISLSEKNLNSIELNNYDYNGNILLYYILENLIKLLDINDNKFTKTKIAYLTIDIINKIYQESTDDISSNNNDLKRFSYFLISKYAKDNAEYLNENTKISDDSEIINPEDEEEYEKTIRESKIDDEEMKDALDMDVKYDFEQDYESGVNIN